MSAPERSVTRRAVLAALESVKDPEIPVVSVVELGIVQSIEITAADADPRVESGDDVDEGARSGAVDVKVTITPTFSGCPALELMRDEIREAILALGARRAQVVVSLDPPWTSDRIAPAARARMAEIGIAPPPPAARFKADVDLELVGLAEPSPVECPFCGSAETRLENPFGPTICRSLHYCTACQQPFERFKPL